MKNRTSRKQVQQILEAISTKTFKYELIPHEFCYGWKYTICTYTREPKIVDAWGYEYSYTDWKFEERVLEMTTLKNAYDFSYELLHKINTENM